MNEMKELNTLELIKYLERSFFSDLYFRDPVYFLDLLQDLGKRDDLKDKLLTRYENLNLKKRGLNKVRVYNDYLNQSIINMECSLNNPSYTIYASDEACLAALEHTFKPIYGLCIEGKILTNELDNKIHNTMVYLKAISAFPVFIRAVEENMVDFEEAVPFGEQYIQPVENAINEYRLAEEPAMKIDAYKKVEKPLKQLILEVYKKSIVVYPNAPKPAYLTQEQPKLAEKPVGYGDSKYLFFGAAVLVTGAAVCGLMALRAGPGNS